MFQASQASLRIPLSPCQLFSISLSYLLLLLFFFLLTVVCHCHQPISSDYTLSSSQVVSNSLHSPHSLVISTLPLPRIGLLPLESECCLRVCEREERWRRIIRQNCSAHASTTTIQLISAARSLSCSMLIYPLHDFLSLSAILFICQFPIES